MLPDPTLFADSRSRGVARFALLHSDGRRKVCRGDGRHLGAARDPYIAGVPFDDLPCGNQERVTLVTSGHSKGTCRVSAAKITVKGNQPAGKGDSPRSRNV
jgi:hypothetical protein